MFTQKLLSSRPGYLVKPSNAPIAMCNPHKLTVANVLCVLLIGIFTFAFSSRTTAQEISLDNYSGDWSDDASWSDGSSPGLSVDGIDLEIYGSISIDGDFEFDKGTLTIQDTLLVFGNFTLLNKGNLAIASTGILIVYGDYTSGSQVEVNSEGYLIVEGYFKMLGSANQGEFTNSGKLFIFDETPTIKDGSLYLDLECTDPEDYPNSCAYGTDQDILTDPIYELFSQSNNNCVTPFELLAPKNIFADCSSDIPPAFASFAEFINAGGSASNSSSIDSSSFILKNETTNTLGSEIRINRFYQISDICGNSATARQILSAEDSIPPTIICPENISVCATNSSGIALSNLAPLSITDNCSPDETISYNYLVSGATSAMGTGSAKSIFFNVGTSIVTYSATDENSNLGSSSFTVTVNPIPKASTISGNLNPSCEAAGEIYSIDGNSNSDYLWTIPPGASLLTDTSEKSVNSIALNYATNGGIISVQEVSEYGCIGEISSTNVDLQGCELVALIDLNKSEVCIFDTVIISSASQGVSATTIYNWEFGNGASSSTAFGPGPHKIVYSSSGTKSITLRISDGATASVKQNLTVLTSPTISLLGNDVCGEDNALFSAQSNTGTQVDFSIDRGASIHSSDNSSPFSFTQLISQGDSLSVVARASIAGIGCQSNWSDMITIKSLDLTSTGQLIAETLNDEDYLDIACPDEIKIYSIEGDTGSLYRWQVEGLGIDLIAASGVEIPWNCPGGTYSLSAQLQTDEICDGSLSQGNVYIAEPEIDLGPDTELCGEESLEVVVGDFVQYNWSTGATGNSTILYPEDGTVTLSVLNAYSCEAHDEITIFNCYSPSLANDGSMRLTPNIVWKYNSLKIINIEQYPSAHLSIYDNHGRTVFQLNNIHESSLSSLKLPTGVYYYLIDAQTGGLSPISGSFSIIPH